MRSRSHRLAAITLSAVLWPAVVSARDTATRLTPDQWAWLVTAPCRANAARTDAADAALAQRLPAMAQSRGQLDFLRRETAARTASAGRHRAAVLARFNQLLVGRVARFPQDTGPGAAGRGESFESLTRHLFAGADPCALEAIEATLLLSTFGLPLDEGSAGRLRPERVFELLDSRLDAALAAGRSAEDVFLAFRPQGRDGTQASLAAVVRAAAHGDGRRQAQFLGLVALAAEPLRIQTYLHAQVDQVEGALGSPVPHSAIQSLLGQAEQALFSDLKAMRRLDATPPAIIVQTLDPLVDRWFRHTALPAVRRSLRRDPFAAFWYYVQSGATPAAGAVFDDAHTVVAGTPFALTAIERLPMRDALSVAREARLPRSFAERFTAIEHRLSEAIPREEVMALVRQPAGPAAERERLEQLLFPDAALQGTSPLVVYSRVLRDASVIRGRLDRRLVGAAMDVLSRAKAARLSRLVDEAVAADPSADPRLPHYLRTAGGLLIELEHRQVLERRFQQRSGGWFVGWILGQFLIAGSVPVALWPPDGVSGAAFGSLVDELTPKNRASGSDYRGKPAERLRLVRDGVEYHDALVEIIDTARDFLNVSAFDWKADAGGRDIAYRLLAKKLGVDGARYRRFLETFANGLPLESPEPHVPVVPFYDIPTTRMKDLLVPFAFASSAHPDVVAARDAARAAGASLACTAVMTCGDLRGLLEQTGERYDPTRSSPGYDRAWQAYLAIEALFAERVPERATVRARSALRDYSADPDALRRFIRRVGLKRGDRPAEPFPIAIVGDGKQNLFNIRVGEKSGMFPYVVSDPIRDVYFVLLEFDIRVVLWKGPLEFPWRLAAVPLPGRRILGRLPMPFVPYPWLAAVPGFQWAGPTASLLLQYLLASDPRVFWAMVSHTKSWSSESLALESGMGMGSKYVNEHDSHKTWHDTGVVVGGPLVGDVNDHFVQVFNQARVNNAGLPASRGVAVPRLRYEDYRHNGGTAAEGRDPRERAWLVTTHPEQGDSNYRGVFMAALAAARRNIFIENSFFSDPLVARMLLRKAREFRGRVSCDGLSSHACAERKRAAVEIHLVLPDSSDKPVVDAVGTADFHEMIHLGVKVHRWSPEAGWSASRMLHTKAWLVDYEEARGGLAYVGAANATQRSHLSDNEAGILSTSPAFAREVYERLFRPDIDTASHREVDLNFHVVRSSNPAVRASRWLRRVLVDLLWFI